MASGGARSKSLTAHDPPEILPVLIFPLYWKYIESLKIYEKMALADFKYHMFPFLDPFGFGAHHNRTSQASFVFH